MINFCPFVDGARQSPDPNKPEFDFWLFCVTDHAMLSVHCLCNLVFTRPSVIVLWYGCRAAGERHRLLSPLVAFLHAVQPVV